MRRFAWLCVVVGMLLALADGHPVAVPIELNTSEYRWLVIVVESLWQDLDAYLAALEARLKAGDAQLRLAAGAREVKPIHGPAPRMAQIPGQPDGPRRDGAVKPHRVRVVLTDGQRTVEE